MASLNDIEGKITNIIDVLSTGGVGVKQYQISYVDGVYTLLNGITFDDILNDIKNNRFVVLYTHADDYKLFFYPGSFIDISSSPRVRALTFYRVYYDLQYSSGWTIYGLYQDTTDETKTKFISISKSI